jgi:hypothetical protein
MKPVNILFYYFINRHQNAKEEVYLFLIKSMILLNGKQLQKIALLKIMYVKNIC